MTDPILTDEEKGALLEGMSNGEVEVRSRKGPQYAEVKLFEIGPRSRIITNSFPRLQLFNSQMAVRMSKFAEQFLNTETAIKVRPVESSSYSDFCGRIGGLFLAVEFSAQPLTGPGLVFLNSELVGHMVEAFFGGSESEPVRRNSEFFTRGEMTVASLFCDGLLATLADIWKPVISIEPAQTSVHMSSAVIDGVDGSDTVICTEFDFTLSGKQESFQLVWPASTVASLLPVFEGKKRERDATEDARWHQALCASVTDSIVKISSTVGTTEMILRDVAELAPGDVISISNPRISTVFAEHVPLLEGRFGVHDGNNAVEAVRWLERGKPSQAKHH